MSYGRDVAPYVLQIHSLGIHGVAVTAVILHFTAAMSAGQDRRADASKRIRFTLRVVKQAVVARVKAARNWQARTDLDGNPMAVRGFNTVGLRRRGFTAERLATVKQMHRLLYRQGRTLDDARAAICALATEVPEAAADVALMSDFLAASTRGIAR